MEYVTGMNCIRCNKYNSFEEGKITSEGTSINYYCDCGFAGVLILPDEKECKKEK